MLKLKKITEINKEKEITILATKSISNKAFNNFKSNINELIEILENSHNKREESIKRDIDTFLKSIGYTTSVAKGDIDLVIEKDDKTQVIIETKSLNNKNDFIIGDHFNCKAVWESVSYFLEEHVIKRNNSLKRIIITNGLDWYIFDAADFRKIFEPLKEQYIEYKRNKKTDSTKKRLYEDIEKYISTLKPPHNEANLFEDIYDDNNDEYINAVYFTLKSIKEEKTFDDTLNENYYKYLYHLFSSDYLLKEFKISNLELNKDFYYELLYILGLKEVKKDNIRLIIDADVENSFYYNLKNRGYNFEDSLELIIIWLNRILFLKLLESQICAFNDEKYKFLNTDKIRNFQDLNDLFFNILANTKENRIKNDLSKSLEFVPYLNSSLFEKTDIEEKLISIESIRNDKIKYYDKTKLDYKNKSNDNIELLIYLFDFLNAYDIKSGSVTDEKVINPAVLGLIFEKINGYKDGSYYTPTVVTSYMAKISIEKTVIDKFKENGYEVNSLADIYNKNINNANDIINSIRICDPAVGSGHFLVSCLNELVKIKYDLRLIQDDAGKAFNKDFIINIDNGELNIAYEDGDEFVYKNKKTDNLSYQFQKAIFNQKREIIENCLFGVDINPKSVEITKLRLWIELLKNAYYTKESNFTNLETLPNIDINIKQGDSLYNDLPLHNNSSKNLNAHYIKDRIKNSGNVFDNYRELVNQYKTTNDKKKKQKINESIKNLKEEIKNLRISSLQREISNELSKYITFYGFDDLDEELLEFAGNENFQKTSDEPYLFKDIDKKGESKKEKKIKLKLLSEIKKISKDIKEIKNGNTFEWTIEFPEMLDESGDFIGFDLIIGNPPYIQLQKDGGKLADLYNDRYQVLDRNGDIYCLFYEQGIKILKTKGYLAYITSNKWLRATYGKILREYLISKNPLLLIDLGPNVFEGANVDTNILIVQNDDNKNEFIGIKTNKDTLNSDYINNKTVSLQVDDKNIWFIGNEEEYKLKNKIESKGVPLKELLKEWGGNIYFGIKTGLNEAFIIDTEKKEEILNNCESEEERQATELLIKPVLRGRDINKYSYKWADRWVIGIFPALNLDIENYPAIKKYFINNFDKRQLEQSGKKYTEFGFNARKKTDNKWFEIQDSISYYTEFEKEKVVWSDISLRPNFTMLPKNLYFNNTVYMISGENKKLKYINGVLNSKITEWYFPIIASGLGEKSCRYFKIFIEELPIRKASEEERKPIIELVDKILKIKAENPDANTKDLEKDIDSLVYKLYDLKQNEIDLVENFDVQ